LTEQHLLKLTDVSVKVLDTGGNERVSILRSVSSSMKRGEWVSLLGGNGSGKSTLAKTIAGLPIEGMTGMFKRSGGSAEQSPIVLQHPDAGLVGATPWEDVILMLEQWGSIEGSRIPALAEKALRAVGLGDRLQQPIDTLSGGQKQLTAIAGCLAASPELLILDEVTAMLDPDMSAYVIREVRRLNEEGMTVLWITQKLEELESRDRVWVMSEGKLVYDDFAHGLFRRSEPGTSDSTAEAFGFEAPYAVQVGWELETRGIRLPYLPLRIRELEEAVAANGG
jgi:energy-coupling factor transport system ATP-binding protein